MNGLGTHVTLLYRGDQILRGFDDDVRDHVADALRARGVVIEIQREATAIERAGERLRVSVDNGETHAADQVLFATGRSPNTEGLGLERLGVGIAAERRGRGRRLVADRGAVDLRHRRRDRPRGADAGGDPRGPGLRRDRLRRPSGALRPCADPDRGLHPARGGGARRHRGRGAGPRRVRDLPLALPPDAEHARPAATSGR